MKPFNRREFLKFCGRLSLALFGTATFGPGLAKGLVRLANGEIKVLWLSGQGCSGDAMALVYGDAPPIVPLLTSLVDLRFHPLLSAAQGQAVIEIFEAASREGNFILCFEGAVPAGMPKACVIGERPVTEWLAQLARAADLVIACGTCASYGGIPHASKETGSISVAEYLKQKGLSKPVVRIPGCPMNPARFTGTVAYFAAYGKLPPLDEDGRPLMYYRDLIHENCLRFHYFVEDKYAKSLSEKGLCLFCFGCRGPLTRADCPLRTWNGEDNWCIRANTPCIGCAHPEFPWDPEEGIYRDPSTIPPKIELGKEEA